MCKTYTTQNFLCTKQSSYDVPYRQTKPCAKPTQLKLFCSKTFMVLIWGHLEAITTFISQIRRISVFHKTPLSCHTTKLGHVQNHHNSKLLCTETFVVFIWGHLEGIPTFTSQKRRISVFDKNTPPSNLTLSCYTAKLGHVQNPPNSKLSCNKTLMVVLWGNFEAIPTLTSQKP